MKKVFLIFTILGGSLAAWAQDKPEPLINRDFIFDFIHVIAVLLVIYFISSFILQLVRSNFDFRLKSKILERQPEENTINRLVQTEKGNPLNTTLQWICALTGVGAGFLLMEFTEPFGLHSLAIMAFSVAAALGLYYFFVTRAKK